MFNRSNNTRQSNDSQTHEGVYTCVDDLLRLRHIAKDIHLEANKKSTAIVEGDSKTHFRGRGMEFAEVRPYQAGDDIRTIDWRVTARTQKPYTKLFQEERERPVFLLVDQRSNMFFGSVNQFKSVYAAQLAATIAWAASQNNDRIGALIFSDENQTDSRAKRGKHAVLSVLHQLNNYNRQLSSPLLADNAISMEAMLTDVRRIAKPGSSVYLISDFHDFTPACSEPLSILARHTDVTAIQVYDPLEKQLPRNSGLMISNGREKLNMSGQGRHFDASYEQSFAQVQTQIRQSCGKSGVRFSPIEISTPTEDTIVDLFTTKRKKRKSNAKSNGNGGA